MRKKMTKRVTGLCIVLILTMLCGCQRGDQNTNQEEKSKAETMSFDFLSEESDAVWEDNRVDDLHAALNAPIKRITIEGESGGKSQILLGEGGCTWFKNHLFGSYKNNWSGVSGVTAEGDEFSLKVELEPDRKGNHIYELGPVSGKNGYVACYYEFKDGKAGEYWLYELDGKFQKVRCVQAKMNTKEFLRSLMGDAEGNFHAIYSETNGKNHYVVVSPGGDLIFDAVLQYFGSLYAYGDGKVAACDVDVFSTYDRWFYKADLESGELKELAVSKDETIRKKMRSFIYDATPAGEQEIVWCQVDGIYAYDLQSKTVRAAYKWSNHGITPSIVDQIAVTSDGSVGVLFEDENGLNYLLLKPTGDKEEIKTIAFAVSPYNKDEYEKMAAQFNRRYPNYAIEIRDDYDELTLMTQLGAGDGPVLVDTEVTGFEALENLWQPMDGFLEQSGLAEDLIPEVMELGIIGETTYGIVKDFRIETLLVPNSGPADWDYEGFVSAAESFRGAPLTYWAIEGKVDWRERFFEVLKGGVTDSYYLNEKTGSMIFGTPEFERAVRVSEKARKCPPAGEGDALRNGEALCEHVDLLIVPQVVRLRRRIEANDERIIGYPTNEGGRNLIVAQAPVAMRSTATEEEKKIAYTFLKTMLSKESQMVQTNNNLSVRRDVLEYQFHQYEHDVEMMKELGTYDAAFAPELDWEKDEEFYWSLIRNGKVKRPFSAGAEKIFDEEFGEYLDGRIDGKTLDDHLKNRVWLYLEEAK